MDEFKDTLLKKVKIVEDVIKAYLPEETGYQKTITEAMNYSFLAGGKRLRPMIMQETYSMFGGNDENMVGPFMAALEMIHTYSLIHDDLPAMDNDDYRRGRKTNHIVFGEAMAILAGDGLLNLAYETASKALEYGAKSGDPKLMRQTIKAMGVLAKKAGIYGMVGGQVVDVESEKKGLDIDRDKLIFIHENKTAALIQTALMCGAILAGADSTDVDKLEQVGKNVGIAFQIQDDILDVTGDEALLGKPVGSDEKNEKATYVSLNGLEKAVADQKYLSHEAIETMKSFNNRNIFLEQLIESLMTRNN